MASATDLHAVRRSDPLSRRRLLESLARTTLGVSVVAAGDEMLSAATRPLTTGPRQRASRAEHVICLFMNGAMSHIDTFDPKPGRDAGGETTAISTSIPGVTIGHRLPELARRMDQLAVIRSMTTETGAHQQGVYLMRTSYKEIGSIRHPFLGSWLTQVEGKLNRDLPGSVVVGAANRHPGQGYLSAEFAPAPVADPKAGLQNTKPPKYLNDRHFEKRRRLISKFEGGFRGKYRTSEVQAYLEYYREAVRLLKSPDLEAFDISHEDEEIRSGYGEHRIGQGCLLARRLIEKRVRFVEVEFGGWDNHNGIYDEDRLPQKTAQLDQALSFLLDDLQQRGLLDRTLVVLTTEFGRTPKINQNAGRDHHPGAFSALLAGAGIRGGQVVGRTDEDGEAVLDGHCYPADFNATIAAACGLPLDEEFTSPSGRPFRIAHDGVPVRSVLS